MNTEIITLPETSQVVNDFKAIAAFQNAAKTNMTPKIDFGVIPGCDKPTLLKPGAEKIAKLLGLCDQYEIIEKTENWETPFFRYMVKCSLVNSHGLVVSQCFAECNSYESKYRWKWLFQSQLPYELQGDAGKAERDKLPSRKTSTNKKMYKYKNDDIFSQVNTILKMAQKRALVGAALSAGRLSEIFTQDVEDMNIINEEPKEELDVIEQDVGPITDADFDVPICCECCGEIVSDKVRVFSRSKFNQTLCLNCQKKVSPNR